jgi:hypothetical protein
MKKINLHKRKYDLFSIIIAVIVLTVLAVGALVFAHFTSIMGDELKESADEMVDDGYLNETNADYATDFADNDIPSFSDNYVFWFFIATFLGLIFTAMYLDFEPSVMIIIFIFGSIAILGAWLGSSINTEFAEDTDLAVTATQMSKTQVLMGSPYFPIFIFAGIIVMMVIMYSKKRPGEYQ